MILYVRTGCPYCARVLAEAMMLDIELEERNVADPAVVAELLARGGKLQVPYLVDEERGKEMYESEDIVDYLHETFTPDP